MRLYLIGFMASGKSTFGKCLAKQNNQNFIDLDDKIEQRIGMSISAFFKTKGEAAFRKIESEVLHETIDLQDCIIATGGGTPCFGGNLAWMQEHGTTLWLNIPLEILVKRLIKEKMHRPLVANLADEAIFTNVKKLYEERLKFYELADFRLG